MAAGESICSVSWCRWVPGDPGGRRRSRLPVSRRWGRLWRCLRGSGVLARPLPDVRLFDRHRLLPKVHEAPGVPRWYPKLREDDQQYAVGYGAIIFLLHASLRVSVRAQRLGARRDSTRDPFRGLLLRAPALRRRLAGPIQSACCGLVRYVS